jgi:hypothetical protein
MTIKGHCNLQLSESEISEINEQLLNSKSPLEKIQIVFERTGDLHAMFCRRHQIALNFSFRENDADGKALIDFAIDYYVPLMLQKEIDDLMDRLSRVDEKTQLNILTGELSKLKEENNKITLKDETTYPYGPHLFAEGYNNAWTFKRPDNGFRTYLFDDRSLGEYTDGCIARHYESYLSEKLAETLKSLSLNMGVTENEQPIESEDKLNPRSKLLLLREFGLLDILMKKLSISEAGKLNAKELSKLIAAMIGADYQTVYRDLMHIYHNTEGSKDRPINEGSVRKIEKFLIQFGLQPQNMPIITNKSNGK